MSSELTPEQVTSNLDLIYKEEFESEGPIDETVMTLARSLLAHLCRVTLRPVIAPDGDGGLRLEWFIGNDKNVRVVIPAQREPYIYYRDRTQSEIKSFSNETVAALLWPNGDSNE